MLYYFLSELHVLVLVIDCFAEELHSLYVELTLLDGQRVYYSKHAGL